ncbi:MAG TPA: CHRD domain-containing protein [Fimbriimonadaceae bacterium]|mgnify:CR=1 FL=1|nr:CHRD domain-containing protein [Fimbriimonadaceae bacterium]
MSNKLFASLLTCLALSAVSNATIWQFMAHMDGLQEVPPNASPGFGMVTGTVDDATGAVTLIGDYNNMLANVTAAHIHGAAAPGSNAGVILGLTHTGGTSGTLTGNGNISLAHVTNMMNGLTYVNVHTSAFPGGEIRGQIAIVPEPGTMVALGLGALALVVRRRKAR